MAEGKGKDGWYRERRVSQRDETKGDTQGRERKMGQKKRKRGTRKEKRGWPKELIGRSVTVK